MHAVRNGNAHELSFVPRPQGLVLDSGFHLRGFRIPGTWFQSLSVGLGFQSLVRFRIPRAVFRIPKPAILQAKVSRIPESRFPYMGRTSKDQSILPSGDHVINSHYLFTWLCGYCKEKIDVGHFLNSKVQQIVNNYSTSNHLISNKRE